MSDKGRQPRMREHQTEDYDSADDRSSPKGSHQTNSLLWGVARMGGERENPSTTPPRPTPYSYQKSEKSSHFPISDLGIARVGTAFAAAGAHPPYELPLIVGGSEVGR